MKGPTRWIALVAILGVVAAACSGNGGEADPSAGTNVEPAKGGTLQIGVSSEPASAAMDPAKEYYSLSWEQMRCCLLRTLYSTNGQALAQGGLELRPDLAASLPEVSEDGLTYTFAIKRGVKFAPPFQNEEITADDFIRALEREATPAASSGGYSFYYSPIVGFDDFGAGKANEIAGLKAIDDYTLEMTLSEPPGISGGGWRCPPRLRSHRTGTLRWARPRGTTRTTDGSWSRRGPTCSRAARTWTSPCRPTDQDPVAGYIPGRSITMVRNPSWDASTDDLRAAYVDSIEITIGGAVADLYDKVQTGDLDYVFDPPEAAALKQYSTRPEPQGSAARQSHERDVVRVDEPGRAAVRRHLRAQGHEPHLGQGGRAAARRRTAHRSQRRAHLPQQPAEQRARRTTTRTRRRTTAATSGSLRSRWSSRSTTRTRTAGAMHPSATDVLAIYASDSATGRKIAALTQQSLEEIGITLDVKGLSTDADVRQVQRHVPSRCRCVCSSRGARTIPTHIRSGLPCSAARRSVRCIPAAATTQGWAQRRPRCRNGATR